MARHSRPHIGIFGRRNFGKSSLINAIAGQDISIVSDIAGTTTDPVKKVMEITGVGPVVLIDTAGIDDTGELGFKRVDRSKKIIKIVDMAILIIVNGYFGDDEINLIKGFEEFNTPYFVICNKSDEFPITEVFLNRVRKYINTNILEFSALKFDSINGIVDLINKYLPENSFKKPTIIGDLLEEGDVVVLVMPQDNEAPEGRLILPQVQTIRDILDAKAVAVGLQLEELPKYLNTLKEKPKMIVTDSQVFEKVNEIISTDILLTSFSILFARIKGNFDEYLKGTPKIKSLKDGDRVLIMESCSHHVTCGDIGREKLPKWINDFTKKKLDFEIVAGLDTPKLDIGNYAIVIQCGGCVVTKKQVLNRLQTAIDKGIPVTNYGMVISYIHGIFDRVIQPFAL